MKDIEFKKLHLEQERGISPLKSHWVKKDFMQPCEAVLVYYQIEPAMEQLKVRDMQIIKSVDYLGLYDVLMSSEFMMESGQCVKLVDFIQWVMSKGFDIPEHLLVQNKDENQLVSNEMQLTLPELKERFVRTYAAYFWKTAQGASANMSAVKLAEDKTFQGAITYVDMEVKDPKKFSEKFSDLGPRSHKKKKTSK